MRRAFIMLRLAVLGLMGAWFALRSSPVPTESVAVEPERTLPPAVRPTPPSPKVPTPPRPPLREGIPEHAGSPELVRLAKEAQALARTPFEPDYPPSAKPLDVFDSWLNAANDRLDLSDALEADLLEIAQGSDPRAAGQAMAALAELYLDNASAFQDTPIPTDLRDRPIERLELMVDNRVAIQEDKALVVYDMLEFHIAGWAEDDPMHQVVRDGRARILP